MFSEPMITVRSVAKSREWYENVLGASSDHGGDDYERIVKEGVVLLQLHHWEADEHPWLREDGVDVGNGLLLSFRTPWFDAAIQRITECDATIIEGPQVNPTAGHREVILRDPNGYTVAVVSNYGDLGDLS